MGRCALHSKCTRYTFPMFVVMVSLPGWMLQYVKEWCVVLWRCNHICVSSVWTVGSICVNGNEWMFHEHAVSNKHGCALVWYNLSIDIILSNNRQFYCLSCINTYMYSGDVWCVWCLYDVRRVGMASSFFPMTTVRAMFLLDVRVVPTSYPIHVVLVHIRRTHGCRVWRFWLTFVGWRDMGELR